MSNEAAAAFFALAGLDKGDVVYLPRRGSYAVIYELHRQRVYIRLLKPAIMWKLFNRGNRRVFYIDGQNLFVWGRTLSVSHDEVQLGR